MARNIYPVTSNNYVYTYAIKLINYTNWSKSIQMDWYLHTSKHVPLFLSVKSDVICQQFIQLTRLITIIHNQICIVCQLSSGKNCADKYLRQTYQLGQRVICNAQLKYFRYQIGSLFGLLTYKHIENFVRVQSSIPATFLQNESKLYSRLYFGLRRRSFWFFSK